MAKEQHGDLLVDVPDAPPWEPKPTSPPRKKLPLPRAPIDDDSMPPTPEPPPASGLSAKNREKLECAKRYVDRLFTLAAEGLLQGHSFYGKTSIEISWVDGVAQDIVPNWSSRDRVGN